MTASEMRWGRSARLRSAASELDTYGLARRPRASRAHGQLSYLTSGRIAGIEARSSRRSTGHDHDGSVHCVSTSDYTKVTHANDGVEPMPATTRRPGHRATHKLLPGRRFPLPEVAVRSRGHTPLLRRRQAGCARRRLLRGSGTTAHAVMRLNKQDGGRRRSIASPTTRCPRRAEGTTEQGLRPGDPDWERWGICDVHHQAADRGRGHWQDARRRPDQG